MGAIAAFGDWPEERRNGKSLEQIAALARTFLIPRGLARTAIDAYIAEPDESVDGPVKTALERRLTQLVCDGRASGILQFATACPTTPNELGEV